MQSRLAAQLAVLISASAVLAASCSGEDGERGAQGKPGAPSDGGSGCTVKDNADGTKTITCADGTKVTVSDGDGGVSGKDCTAVQEDGGAITVTCGDASVTIPGPTQPDASVTPPAPGPGLKVDAKVSAPANGTHFATGEKIVLTFELADGKGNPLQLKDMKRANLYLNGPRDVLKNKTASALLKAETDRSKPAHHYIDLKTTTNPNLVVAGSKLTYTLEPVTTEDPGTYTAGLWAEVDGAPLDQVFELADLQIGTATVEPLIVGVADGAGTGSCADCHKGSANGRMYLHHIDPGYSPDGNPSLDAVPVRTCKSCHNQDGYAAVRKCADGSKPVANSATPPKYICADNTENWTWMNDPIVRRVHGVHVGSKLMSTYNSDDFINYEHTVFPYDVRNCTKCHTNDAWKAKPSRQACSACHDNLNYTNGKYEPPKVYTIPYTGGVGGKCVAASVCSIGTCNLTSGICECSTNAQCAGLFGGFNGVCAAGKCELQTHGGGVQTDDTGCKSCHAPDTGLAAVAAVHKVAAPVFKYALDVTMTPPLNTTHYVAGEAPTVKIIIKDNATGTAIDHTTVTQAAGWGSSQLFVNGPRARRIPQLTTAARPETTGSVGPWDLSAAVDLQLKVGSTTLKIPVSTAVKKAGATATEVVTWLNADASFKALAFATLKAGAVTLQARPSTKWTQLEILASTVTTALGYTVGVYTEISGSTSYAANNIYLLTAPGVSDPKAIRTAADISYKLDDVATAEPGTYTLFVKIQNTTAGAPHARKLLNFQVGSATAEKLVATNCKDCHGDNAFHGWAEFKLAPDVCGSCHDYRRQARDRTTADTWVDGWGASAPPSTVIAGRGNMGNGAGPFSRRLHGVHFLNYLSKPAEVHSLFASEHFIFPQDVRNCTKCHAETATWSQKPGRLPCMGCHDSDAAKAHASQMTFDPTPVDPWNGDEQESCGTCHGANKDNAVSDVHNITNPYVPPYPRE